MNEHQKRAAEAMRTKGLPGVTQKFSIEGELTYDFYLKLAWHEYHLDYLDLTVSGAQDHNIRALVELVCKEAYALLRAEVWTVDKLVREWRGYPFEPMGYCPQLEGIVRSPIDAAARLIERRKPRWETK